MLFNLFTVLPFTACLFWTTTMVIDWRRSNPPQHILTIFMAVCTLLYFCHAAYFNGTDDLRTVTDSVYAFCTIAVYPTYLLYIMRLTQRHLRPLSLALLLPAIIIGLWATWLYIFRPQDHDAQCIRLTVTKIVFIIQLIPVCWIGYRRLKCFDKKIEDFYSDVDSRSVKHTRNMMFLIVFGALISAVSNHIGREYFALYPWLLAIPSLLFTILLYGVGYVGIRQEFCIDDLERDNTLANNEQQTEGSEQPTANNVSAIMASLEALMGDEQVYLNPDLRLPDLSQRLGVGRTLLSQRINQEYGSSFSDYVNQWRIRHACRLLEDTSTARAPLFSDIAEQSGFSSESSFYRAFKKHTGVTPRQWLNDHR